MANRIEAIFTGAYEEAVAGEAGIYPGMLLTVNSDGEVIKNATEGGLATDETLIAFEDALQGNTIATVFVADDIVPYGVPRQGDQVRFLIEAGTAIAIGDILYSNGDGTLQEASALASAGLATKPVAVAMEALDLSASGADNAICLCRVL